MGKMVVRYRNILSSKKYCYSYKEFSKSDLNEAIKFSIKKNGKYFDLNIGGFYGSSNVFLCYDSNDDILKKIEAIGEKILKA